MSKIQVQVETLKNDIAELGFNLEYDFQELNDGQPILITSQPGAVFYLVETTSDTPVLGFQVNMCANPSFVSSLLIGLSKKYRIEDVGVYAVKDATPQPGIIFVTDIDEIVQIQKDFIKELAESIKDEDNDNGLQQA